MKNELPQPDLFVLQEDEHIDHLTSQAFFPFFLQIYFIKIGKVLSVNKKILFILRPSIRLPYRYIYIYIFLLCLSTMKGNIFKMG